MNSRVEIEDLIEEIVIQYGYSLELLAHHPSNMFYMGQTNALAHILYFLDGDNTGKPKCIKSAPIPVKRLQK